LAFCLASSTMAAFRSVAHVSSAEVASTSVSLPPPQPKSIALKKAWGCNRRASASPQPNARRCVRSMNSLRLPVTSKGSIAARSGPREARSVQEKPWYSSRPCSGSVNGLYLSTMRRLVVSDGNDRVSLAEATVPSGATRLAHSWKETELRVTDGRLAAPEEWDAAWADCGWASYFQSRPWAELWGRWRPGTYRPQACSLKFEDGPSVILPMVVERRFGGALKVVRLSAADTYGGWLSPRELPAEQAQAALAWARDSLGNMTWVLNPYEPGFEQRNLPGARLATTFVIDLEAGFDALHSGWSKGHRAAAGQALRAGVEVRRATSPDDWDRYGACFEASVRRWKDRYGAPPWGLVRLLAQEPHSAVSLLVAIADGIVVSGAVLLADKRVTTYWHAASMAEGLRLKAPTLLVQEAIRTAANSGQTTFDMGGSGGHEGVERFKLGFRPRRLNYPVLVTEGPLLRMARAARDLRRLLR